MDLKLEHFRREYLQGGLDISDLSASPFEQFKVWMGQVIESGILDPNAMTVATVDSTGQPSQRIVLLKHADENGFIFYTNLESKKGQDLRANPNVSLHFPWYLFERQVEIGGIAEQLPAADVQRYFATRPRESQLGAWASHQSRPIASRAELMQQFAHVQHKFSGCEIPVPEFWGGFRVKPHLFEFWQGGAARLHDRFQYTLDDQGKWVIQRLEP